MARRRAVPIGFLVMSWAWPAAAADPASQDPVERGEYIFDAAGCNACHTMAEEGAPRLAGGVVLATPFGTFHTPNISPDPEHGIGAWSDEDFIRALREGEAPDGSAYYPAFPYPSYTAMTEADMRDLKAYIFSQPPVARPDEPHALDWPFGWRFLLRGWRTLYFAEGPRLPPEGMTADLARGFYLVDAVAHCGECHTPRNAMGALDRDRWLSGNPSGPEGKPVPNITPHETGLAGWSVEDVAGVLDFGMTPEGDFVGGAMGLVVEETTGRLTDADREAIARYVLSLPAMESAAGP
jgi:mono/diheme cytochrome c family protein